MQLWPGDPSHKCGLCCFGAGGAKGSMVEFGQVDFGQSDFPSLRADFGSDFGRIKVQMVRWTLAKTLTPQP